MKNQSVYFARLLVTSSLIISLAACISVPQGIDMEMMPAEDPADNNFVPLDEKADSRSSSSRSVEPNS